MLDTFINHELKDNVAEHLSNSIIINQLLSIKDSFSDRIEYINPDWAKRLKKAISNLSKLPDVITNVLIQIDNTEYKLNPEKYAAGQQKRNKGRKS